jgi:polar amino acid transport system substrate-binding protein
MSFDMRMDLVPENNRVTMQAEYHRITKNKKRAGIKALVCLLASFSGLAAGAEDLSMTANIWPPYVDDDLSQNGFVIALVSDALERAGYKTSVVVEPFPKALEATKAGDYDVYCNLWFTSERASTLTFSEPYIENEITFIKRAESDFIFRDRADLKGLRVGIVSDYAYSQQPYDTTGITVSEAGSVKENIRRLLSGDIDLVLADRRVAMYEVNELRAAKSITVLPQPLSTRGLRIAVSKKRADYKEIVAAFDQAIAAMKTDGSYNAILASYRVNY